MVAATDIMTGLTQERLKALLRYEPETGEFWYPPSRRKPEGRPAGCLRDNGYWYIRIMGRAYYAHRLAWLYMTGEWPTESVDHVDLNRSNNRWYNLRAASLSDNRRNSSVNKNTASGIKGVYSRKDGVRSKPWCSAIRFAGRTVHLGYFATPEEANAAYHEAAVQHFGQFARSA